jgi:hypothetical protein
LRRLNVDLVCGEGNSDGSDSTLLPLPAGRRDEDNTMNSFYVANDTVVIFDRAIFTRETGKEEGWNFKNCRFGSAGSFDPLFKTD